MPEKMDYIKYFQKVWSKNKAVGLAAQTHLEKEIQSGSLKKHSDKLFHGCWLLSPKWEDWHKFRLCFFTHDKVLKNLPDRLDPKEFLMESARPFYAVAEYMSNAGIGVVYAVPTTTSGSVNLESFSNKDYSSLNWHLFLYEKEGLHRKSESDFFKTWGDRGRPTYRKDSWNDKNLEDTFSEMKIEQLDGLLLNELFYTGYLKTILKKAANDPYDVDSFVVSLSQKHIFPIELKEKFPVLTKRDRYFGIDAGRIMMLLRICVPNDSNALYIIRQVSKNGRNLEGWKFITLSKIIMSSSWNLQAGGKGMGGSDTQTIRLPYDEFEDLTEDTLSEDNLKKLSNLPKDVKEIVQNYKSEFPKRFS